MSDSWHPLDGNDTSIAALRQQYYRVFGKETNSNNGQWLQRRLTEVHNEVLNGLNEDALDHYSNHSGNDGGGGGGDALASDLDMSDLEGDDLDGSNHNGSNTGERGDFFGVVGLGGYRSSRHSMHLHFEPSVLELNGTV